ncbi:hypothetical protein J6590_009208 [Homalodisca vitripennis]|nr:hypothetical protein J6590_009208 [Homalodisca vitripennis]
MKDDETPNLENLVLERDLNKKNPVTREKIDSLREQLKYIPEEHQWFYRNIIAEHDTHEGADNNGGYEPLTDEEVIASFLPGANESDAEEADGDIEDPVMSHGDAVTKLNELMVYFERQAETSPAELLMLKRLQDRQHASGRRHWHNQS